MDQTGSGEGYCGRGPLGLGYWARVGRHARNLPLRRITRRGEETRHSASFGPMTPAEVLEPPSQFPAKVEGIAN